jgi:hypothetical protein
MSFLDKGIDWFNEKRKQNVVEPVKVTTAGGSRTVLATVIEPESEVNAQGLRAETDHVVFLIESAAIHNLLIQRGCRIVRQNYNTNYEVVATKRQMDDYNDPNETTRAIPAKKLCYSPT